MSVTEEQAKEKRCCGPEGCGGSLYLHKSKSDERWCIGSLCMAWRHVGQIGIGPNGERRNDNLDGLTRWTNVGRCGLAGPRDTIGG
jgi:hypothetical protein